MLKCSFMFFVSVILIQAVIVSSEGMKGLRQSKIFTFNADDEDIEVGLDISIPFLKIPLKKTFNAVAEFGLPGINLSKINLNPMAIVLGALIIISTSIFAPILNSAFAWHHLDRSSRINLENETRNATLHIAEHLLANSGGCPERIACWSSRRFKNPRSQEVMKTLKQIMSNKLLSALVNTTALETATVRGRSGQSCESYAPCPLEERSLSKIINNLEILMTRDNYKRH